MPPSRFRALVETHLEPVLVRAGCAAGQWSIDDASATFCAAADDYLRRHPRLVDASQPWDDCPCVDVVIHGSVDSGITRFDVEFEPLADLLARTGHRDDVAALRSLFALTRPDDDLRRLAEILSRLFTPGEGYPMFTFPLTAGELFAERRRQFRGWGVPDLAIDAVEPRVTDLWADGPGGWTTEWCRQAGELEEQERWLDAALTYGAARFPCLATPARVAAYDRQLALFARAADGEVRRESVPVTYRTSRLTVPVHRYASPRPRATLLLTGGVDTWKVELHRMATALQQLGELDVVVFDMPGTGECDVALAPDADVVYAQVAEAVRRPGRPVGVMGISFGGGWAAKLALRRQVDFAVDVGGPVGAQRPGPRTLALPNGMAGIVAHALRLDALPAPDELAAIVDGFSLAGQGLLGPDRRPAPILVVNGADDVYVPAADSTVFEQYADADVHLVPGAGHCAAERITDVVARAITWITTQTPTP